MRLHPLQIYSLKNPFWDGRNTSLEVMRDLNDNVVIICSIENVDAMGVHTGDSITVAPAQTLTDKEYQELRNAAIKVIREIGVDTGGSNVQVCCKPSHRRADNH